jgi:hypothetical protein
MTGELNTRRFSGNPGWNDTRINQAILGGAIKDAKFSHVSPRAYSIGAARLGGLKPKRSTRREQQIVVIER